MARQDDQSRFSVAAGTGRSLAATAPGLEPGFLDLPARPPKPRLTGLTIVIDPGHPTSLFRDVVESHGDLFDIVKFGWGTALATRDLSRKLDILRMHGIDYFFGGTLFEKALQQNRVEAYLDFCEDAGCRWVEISDGTLEIAPDAKARHIATAACRFRVMSEVGYKDSVRSERLTPADWVARIEADFAAGARFVVTEARESGTSGICRADGALRDDLVDAILAAGIDPRTLVFEAPNKALQSFFVGLLGTNVNLANIALADLVGVETLRLGLRSDTLLVAFDRMQPEGATP